jgi:hypothetical protein
MNMATTETRIALEQNVLVTQYMRILKDYGIESNQYGLKIDERLYFGKSIILVNDNKFLIPMTFKENKYTGCTDKDIRCASFQNFEYVGTVLIKYDPTKKKRQYAKHVFSASETSWSTGKWLASLCEYLANGHIPVRINNLWDAASEGDRPTNQEPCECPVLEDAARGFCILRGPCATGNQW